MGQPKVGVQRQDKRIKTFQEVSLGYSKRVTVEESKRCPQCTEPACVVGCPIGINIPGFIRLLREGNVAGAYEIIKEKNFLPSICGRICSAPCEAACILTEEEAPIGIRALERYASDFGSPRSARHERVIRKGKKVAIIGSGPAGLTVAATLANKGFQVTVFEALDKPGGVLRYGIPNFRIPKKVLEAEIKEIEMLGVIFETSCFIGQTITMDELRKDGFEAILLSMGAGIPKFMDLPGANLGGVYYGEEFLMRINQLKDGLFSKKIPSFNLGAKIAVIGSGNTALDCARSARRLGKEVTLLFRRTEGEMRLRNEELLLGKDEGVHLEPLVRPLEIMANQNNFVGGLKCIRLDYADENETGNWQLMEVPGSEFTLDVETVIIAVGHKPNSLINQFDQSVKLTDDGSIWTDPETMMTSIKGVFAAGNVVTNAGPVVEAIASGKNVAEQIYQYLTK